MPFLADTPTATDGTNAQYPQPTHLAFRTLFLPILTILSTLCAGRTVVAGISLMPEILSVLASTSLVDVCDDLADRVTGAGWWLVTTASNAPVLNSGLDFTIPATLPRAPWKRDLHGGYSVIYGRGDTKNPYSGKSEAVHGHGRARVNKEDEQAWRTLMTTLGASKSDLDHLLAGVRPGAASRCAKQHLNPAYRKSLPKCLQYLMTRLDDVVAVLLTYAARPGPDGRLSVHETGLLGLWETLQIILCRSFRNPPFVRLYSTFNPVGRAVLPARDGIKRVQVGIGLEGGNGLHKIQYLVEGRERTVRPLTQSTHRHKLAGQDASVFFDQMITLPYGFDVHANEKVLIYVNFTRSKMLEFYHEAVSKGVKFTHLPAPVLPTTDQAQTFGPAVPSDPAFVAVIVIGVTSSGESLGTFVAKQNDPAAMEDAVWVRFHAHLAQNFYELSLTVAEFQETFGDANALSQDLEARAAATGGD